jgi:hypothetical protein
MDCDETGSESLVDGTMKSRVQGCFIYTILPQI